MIKANELVWDRGQAIINGMLRYKYDYDFISNIPVFVSRLDGIGIFGGKRAIWTQFNLKSEEEAKAACQAHYNEMAKSMVDMGHLKPMIEEAVKFGFIQGIQCERARRNNSRHFEEETDEEREQRISEFPGQEKLLSLAQEAFLKTLEQEREG